MMLAAGASIASFSSVEQLFLPKSPPPRVDGVHLSLHAAIGNHQRRSSSSFLLHARRFSTYASVSEDPAPVQHQDIHIKDPINSTEASSEDEQRVASHFDWGWVPTFPHAITASMANFMFGYHLGIMNGPLISIAHELNFEGDTILEGFVVSTFLVGAFIGSISGGVLADRIGRRRTFQLDMAPLILGTALSATSENVNVMIVGRFLVGIGIGVNAGLVPVYISEVAPTKYRGGLGSLCQIGTCLGLIAVLILGIPSEADPHWWRSLFWIGMIPAVLVILGMEFAVESPRWLSKVGRWAEAENVIRQLWGDSSVESALEELRSAAKLAESAAEISWSELMSKRYYKAPVIGSALFALQQFAGINGVLYFSSLTFRDAGVSNGMLASAFVAVANLLGQFGPAVSTSSLEIRFNASPDMS